MSWIGPEDLPETCPEIVSLFSGSGRSQSPTSTPSASNVICREADSLRTPTGARLKLSNVSSAVITLRNCFRRDVFRPASSTLSITDCGGSTMSMSAATSIQLSSLRQASQLARCDWSSAENVVFSLAFSNNLSVGMCAVVMVRSPITTLSGAGAREKYGATN